jgi:hypothetical protein
MAGGQSVRGAEGGMNTSDTTHLIDAISARVAQVPGVDAVVLGGSRGRGSASPDSDIDLGIYYSASQPFDLDRLRQTAAFFDDEHRSGILTQPGGWGKWVNGGGWLVVKGIHVDFLYRDLERVSTVIDECQAGRIQIDYHPGHPHAFPSPIYIGEVATCRILQDPHGLLSVLKARTVPYPDALRDAVLQTFFWEAAFSLAGARKGAARADTVYTAGCLFRSAECLLHSLFALNSAYWLNEKGAVALAEQFAIRPDNFQERISRAFQSLESSPAEVIASIDFMDQLIQETEKLLPTTVR